MSKARQLRRIAVVTGTRAEFGLLEPVLAALRDTPGLEPRLIVTGMHLLRKFGRTIDQIRKAGWPIAASVPMQTGTDDADAEPLAVARGVAGIGQALARQRCDAVLVLGDRIEVFAAATAAATSRRVLAHIHGGDRARGDIDDALRNAISRLAHVHFTATPDAEERLLRMGEPRSRVHCVGAPGLDGIRIYLEDRRRDPAADAARRRRSLAGLADRPYAVVLQHPTGRAAAVEAKVARHIIAAVERAGLAGVALYPNSDPGHAGIISVWERLKSQPIWRIIPSLPRLDFLAVACGAAVLIGNSSSGIIESASLGLNAVNVGDRQLGRLPCGPGVIACDESAADIEQALNRALAMPRPQPGHSVYGDGHAGERIARLLRQIALTPDLLQKTLSY